ADSAGSTGDGVDLVVAGLRLVERSIVVPEEDDASRVAAVPATQAAAPGAARHRRECVEVDRRSAGDVEDSDSVRSATGSANPGTASGRRPVPADAASDGLDGVAACVGVHRANQEKSVRVTARAAVTVRRTAVSARSSVATAADIDGIPGKLVAAYGTRHFDGNCRPGIPASAPRDGRAAAATGAA